MNPFVFILKKSLMKKITKKQLINESLNEGISDIAYHFTTLPALRSMITSNTISLSDNYDIDDMRNSKIDKYSHYLSTTTSKSFEMGYQKESFSMVRLELNGKLLSSNFYIARVTDFLHSNRMDDIKVNNKYNYDEMEDRVLSNKSTIPFDKYVTNITIAIRTKLEGNENHYKYLKEIVDLLRDDEIAFNIEGKFKNEFLEYYKKKRINEAINFHYGDLSNSDDTTPEYSDNILRMSGRHTGHFGSGVYFSTYSMGEDKNNNLDKYRDSKNIDDLTKIKDGLLMVDLDKVPNMFKVNTKETANLLYKTLKISNELLYYIVANRDSDINKIIKENKEIIIKTYRIIRNNFKQMGINIMDIKDFVKIYKEGIKDFYKASQEGIKDYEGRLGSISTRIMTYLGYSGVNVSNIPNWDNTTHGSVIYNSFDIPNKKEMDLPQPSSENIKQDDSINYLHNIKELNKLNKDELVKYFDDIKYADELNIDYDSYLIMNNMASRMYVKTLRKFIGKEQSRFKDWIYIYFHKYFDKDTEMIFIDQEIRNELNWDRIMMYLKHYLDMGLPEEELIDNAYWLIDERLPYNIDYGTDEYKKYTLDTINSY